MKDEKEIDHEYTDNIVCPHCGYQFSDCYEFEDQSGEIECYKCEGDFHYEREISVTYTTTKIV